MEKETEEKRKKEKTDTQRETQTKRERQTKKKKERGDKIDISHCMSSSRVKPGVAEAVAMSKTSTSSSDVCLTTCKDCNREENTSRD